MNFDHFFTGKMSREEAASAFLAMALEGSTGFRTHFLDQIEAPDDSASREWAISVEDARVDLTLRAAGHVILIENKVDSGAVRTGQLLGYYNGEVKRSPDSRITVVMLAPGGVGSREVDGVKSCADMRARSLTDRVIGASWADLIEYPADDGEKWVRDGLDAIRRAIEKAASAAYPAVGSRLELRKITDAAAVGLRTRGTTGVMRWSAKDKEALVLTGMNVTANVWLQFTCSEAPGAPVIDAPDASGRWTTLRLHTKVKPLGALKARSALKQWWKEPLAKGSLSLGPGMELTPVGGGWLGTSRSVEGDAAALSNLLVTETERLVAALGDHLASVGLPVREKRPVSDTE
ncbi:hypothetical protein TBR22_A06110 [Luteitalea sp. TBR-22]|uniref:PD-(D/E)XK nuclease family protein n=1 Tax=Luteitalea sp. TBR-22 TaxID=2802971 RepID=UPI001AF5FD60|nr:PD-(D/E)XK nuclease family protein [Luteitalea sp. TBR-22]BCS31410.1 hypothetical protein TBR22_A06110 [Luteitalea sp. TBR-22]